MKNIQNVNANKNGYIDFCHQMTLQRGRPYQNLISSVLSSPLHTIRLYSRTMTKSFFRETGRKPHYTLFVVDSSFHEYDFRLPSHEKSPLSFIQKRSIERRRCRMQNEKHVRKTSAKMVYTLFAFRSFFVISLIFRYCS